MKIHVFDNGGITCDRYVVFIGKHIFNMSYYADRANEVNMYMGTYKSNDDAMIAVMNVLKNNQNINKLLRRQTKIRNIRL